LYVRAAFESIYGVLIEANTVESLAIAFMEGILEITYEKPLKIVYS
jgi:hypothetical protein